MIYNRYNPCHVVYVLYNCTISFEGLSNPIHMLIITRWYLCKLPEHQAGHCRPAASRSRKDSYEQECSLLHDRNFNVACETGIRYPSYEVMYCREKLSLRLSVSISHWYTMVILCIYLSYFDFSWSVSFPGWSARRNRRRSPGSRASEAVLAVVPERIERPAPADRVWKCKTNSGSLTRMTRRSGVYPGT